MARRKKKSPRSEDPTLKELRHIKNLLTLSLIKQGATSDEIKYAIGGNPRDIFPMREIEKGVLVVVEKE